MSLRFKILLAALLPAVFAVLIGIWLLLSWDRVDRVRLSAETADEIRSDVGEISSLVQEYLLHASPRVVVQLERLHDRLAGRLVAADFQDEEERALLEGVRRRHDELDRLLALLLEGKAGSREQIVGALLTKVYDARNKSRQLAQIQHDKVVDIQRAVDRRILFALVILTLLSMTVLALLGRRLLRSLADLNAGIRRIDAGDLSQAIPLRGSDELSNLARAFNDMTRRLGDSYTSIEHLQQEIEQRRRVEQALHGSELRFEATFEQAAVGIALVAPDGRWLRVNRKLCGIVGYPPEELLTKTFQDITHPDDLEADLGHVQRMLAKEIDTYAMEKRYFRKDGNSVWINLTVALAWKSDGSPDYFISVIEDISARKEVELALQASEANLREAQRLASLGHWKWDLAKDRHFWSDEIYAIYGRDPALPPATYPEVQGYFTPEGWSTLAAAVEQALAAGAPYECDAEVVRPDGGHRWITARGEAVRDAAGNVIELRGTVQDVTARAQAEEDLRHRNEELERFDRVSVGRELHMIELKRQVNALARELGREPPYDLGFAEHPEAPGQ